MVYGHGINDMPYGWMSKNDKNKRVYTTWCHMLARCYYDKVHEKYPTYKDCNVCNRWLFLSNFVDDFSKIDGYDEEKFLKSELCLDKDIKSNGTNKEYSLENCVWVSNIDNIKQAVKTRDNSYLYNRTGENNPCSIKIVQYDKKTHELIKVWNSSMDIKRELGINQSNIIQCCKWYACGEDLEGWLKIHKRNPLKSAGGYIWKYYNKNNKN